MAGSDSEELVSGVWRLLDVDPGRVLPYLSGALISRRWPAAAVHVLRAEVLARADLDAADLAARTAITLENTRSQPLLLVAATAVFADIACQRGDPSTVQACADYEQLADDVGDYDRIWAARAVTAVAVYQHNDCQKGRRLLSALHTGCDILGARIVPALAAAADLMRKGCTSGYPTSIAGWAPLPGGLLCPARQPNPAFLTVRLLRRPGQHHCQPPTTEPTPARPDPDEAQP